LDQPRFEQATHNVRITQLNIRNCTKHALMNFKDFKLI